MSDIVERLHQEKDNQMLGHPSSKQAVAELLYEAAISLSEAEQKLQDAKKIAVNAESYGYGYGLEAAASYHDHMAAHHAANHKHVVSDLHEMMEETHVKCASDIRALQSEER